MVSLPCALCGSNLSYALMLKNSCHIWWTEMVSLLCGSSHVSFQVTWFWEALATHCALEGLFTYVSSLSSLLSFQETWCRKAHIKLCTCMAPIMIPSVIWLRKLLSHMVHLNDFSPLRVLWWILKTDVTFAALKWFLSCVGPVRVLFK